MDNIKLYAVLDKKSDTISNVFLSDSDVSAGRFMVQNFKAIYKDVPNELKSDFLDRVHDTCIVKIGEVNPLNKALINEYNVICDFVGFDFEEVKNGKEAS